MCVGTRMPSWVREGYTEYARRFGGELRLRLVEIPLGVRGRAGDAARAIRQEGERMLAAVPRENRVVSLDIHGQSWSTEELAKRMAKWFSEGRDLSLLVGGPDGLAAQCRQRADDSWSLSRLTLPHGLVRVLVAEQVYRAWSLLRNHPYHRGE